MNRESARIALACVMAALVLAGAGCVGAPPSSTQAPVAKTPAFPVTITDDASRTVTIESAPQRIVSLAPANTEIVYALGLGDKVFGVTTFDDYPPQVKQVPKVGDFSTPNMEAIAGARPDIVLVTGGEQAGVISKLQDLGATVLVIDPQNLEGVMTSIGKVGRALGVSARADRVVGGMRVDLEKVRSAVAKDKPVTAFVEIGWKPLFTAGAGTLLGDMVGAAGGINVVKQAGYVGYSTEQLVKDQPYAYLGTRSSIGDPLGLEARPGYSDLMAVQQGRIFVLDDNLVSRPGPRVVAGVRQIAEALHPDAFGK